VARWLYLYERWTSKRLSKAGYGCQHVKSSTSNTLFHKVKFGLQKAFCVIFEMSTSSKSVSNIQMGKRFDIRQGTDWYFMQKVTTDKCRGYRPIAKAYDIKQIESNKGLNFKALHTKIHQVKSCIRTTYSWVNYDNLNRCFNEFCFRINRSQSTLTIFNNLITRMISCDKIYQSR